MVDFAGPSSSSGLITISPKTEDEVQDCIMVEPNSIIEEPSSSGPNSPNFLEPFECSDITLMVEDTPVYAVKSILSIWSPVFRRMLADDFLEKRQNRIDLPGKDVEAVVQLMQHLHPPHNMNMSLSPKEAELLLPLAHEYQITSLLNKLENSLIEAPFEPTFLVLGEYFGLKRLLESCLKQVNTLSYSEVKTNMSFLGQQLSPELSKKMLLASLDSQQKSVERLEKENMEQEQTILSLKKELKESQRKTASMALYRDFASQCSVALARHFRHGSRSATDNSNQGASSPDFAIVLRRLCSSFVKSNKSFVLFNKKPGPTS